MGNTKQSTAQQSMRGLEPLDRFRVKARNIVKEASSKATSVFATWTSDSLQNLLIHYNVQVRGLNQASHKTLVKICEELFGAECAFVEKDFIKFYTMDDVKKMDRAAKAIQWAYIDFRQRQYRKSFRNMVIDVANIECVQERVNGCSVKEHEEDDRQLRYPLIKDEVESRDHCNGDTCPKHETEVHGNMVPGSDLSKEERNVLDFDQELESEWIKPSWRAAKRFEAENRPHRSGRSMKKYNWKSVTLGRHCTFGGCGEQLDLWDEGQMSEFAQFGSGITNYFKVSLVRKRRDANFGPFLFFHSTY